MRGTTVLSVLIILLALGVLALDQWEQYGPSATTEADTD